jgi:beta-lactamase regulating signal transducer with metallopeptidase domain
MLANSMAWALLHSVWQGMLVWGILYIVLKALREAGQTLRYYLSYGALASIFLWFAGTWMSQFQRLSMAVATRATNGAGNTAVTTMHLTGTTAATNLTAPSLTSQLLQAMEHNTNWIVALYCAGLVIMLLRFAISVAQVQALKTHDTVVPEQALLDKLQYLKSQLGIERQVALMLSARIDVPMMVGALKPIILIPIATMNNLSVEQTEAILLHELAHIKRHDYILNMLQTVAETILFFNPFVWLISRVVRQEREQCCDDIVVECTHSPLPYAKALAILEASRINSNQLAMAATGTNNQLLNRIKRIMIMKRKNLSIGQISIIVAAFIMLALIVGMATFTPSFAQKVKKQKDDTATRQHVYKYKTVTIDKDGKRTEKEVITRSGKDTTASLPVIENDIQSPEVEIVEEHGTRDNDDKHVKHFKLKSGVHIITVLADDPLKDANLIKQIQILGNCNDADYSELEDDLRQIMKEAFSNADQDEVGAKIEQELLKEMARHRTLSLQQPGAVMITESTTGSKSQQVIVKNAAAANATVRREAAERRRQAELDRLQARQDKLEAERARIIVEKERLVAERNRNSNMTESEIAEEESRKAIEESRKAIAESKKAIEESRQAIEDSKRAVEESKKIVAANKVYTEKLNKKIAIAMEMAKEGLLDKNEFKIERKDGAFYINGTKQPQDIADKYAHYFDDNMKMEYTNKKPAGR